MKKSLVILGLICTQFINAQKKLKSIDINKIEILEKLTSKIVSLYHFKEGEYQQKLNFDNAIKESAMILKDEKKYSSLLN